MALTIMQYVPHVVAFREPHTRIHLHTRHTQTNTIQLITASP